MAAGKSSPRPDRPAASYQPLVIITLALAGGILCDRCWPRPAPAWWLAAAAALLAWWLAWRRSSDRVAACYLLLAMAACGATWHHLRWNAFGHDELGLFAETNAQPVCAVVRALEAPRRIPAAPQSLGGFVTGDRSRLEVEAVALRDGELWKTASGRSTLVVDGHLLDIEAGDRLRVFAQLSAPSPTANPGEFDFARHAQCDRHLCVLRSEHPQCVARLAPGGPLSIRRWLDNLRQGGDRLLWTHIDPQRSGLAAAMFLGLREELDPDQTQAFLETGTIHLLVISGLNVGILAACLLLALRTLLVRRSLTLITVGSATLLYAVATGAQPPVVRATVMVLVACAAHVYGRRVLAASSLALAAFVVLLLNPTELFRTGTQLSFLSVAALIWVARQPLAGPVDPLTRLIRGSRPWPVRLGRRLGQQAYRATLASAAIWLLICPLVMARFHLLSPAAVVLGPLVALPVAVSMAAGFGVLLVGPAVPAAGTALGAVCDSNLWFIERCVEVARIMPMGHHWVSGPSDWWLGGFYGLLGLFVAAGTRRPPRRWCAAAIIAWTSVGLSASWIGAREAPQLRCTFLSVGHGCAVVAHLPDGQTLLYDAGRLGSGRAAATSISAYLWSQGILHLDAVVISHADADHYNALPELLQKFSIGAVYVSPVMFEDPSGAVGELKRVLTSAGLAIREIWGGDRLRSGNGCVIDVLHPPRRGVLGSDNANSIVLSLAWQDRRILLTGDLEPPGLDDLLVEEPLDCDVVLAPHHGSRLSDPPGLAAWSSPELVVVSGGLADDVATRFEGRIVSAAARSSIRPWLAQSLYRSGAVR